MKTGKRFNIPKVSGPRSPRQSERATQASRTKKVKVSLPKVKFTERKEQT